MILDYKDIPVYYTDQGQGPAVVLLHGFLETSTMWHSLIPELMVSNRVIAIDLLGHGSTGCLGYIHTMEMMAEAVEAVLDYLKIKNITVIGHSMGGYVALALAENIIVKINKICLLNSTPFADSRARQINRDRAIKAVKYNHKNFIRMSITNLFGPNNRACFSNEIEDVKNEAMQVPLQGIIAALEGMKIRKDRSALFKTMEAIKLAILGTEDPVLESKELTAGLEKLEVEIVHLNGGHMSYIENKSEITSILLHFIEN